MNFTSYIADKETSFLHIKEVIKRTKNKELREKISDMISYGISVEDITMECWIRAWDGDWRSSARHRKEYCNKAITDIVSNKVARKTTSVVTYYAIKKLHEKLINSKSIESKLSLDDSFDINKLASYGISYDHKLRLLLLELGVKQNTEEHILLLLTIKDLDETDAMRMLNCSRRTLYRKKLEFTNSKRIFYKDI
jgi:hypothetical protein